jgi:hypothetical protein
MEQNTTIDEDRIEDGIVNDAGDRVLTNDKIDYKAL